MYSNEKRKTTEKSTNRKGKVRINGKEPAIYFWPHQIEQISTQKETKWKAEILWKAMILFLEKLSVKTVNSAHFNYAGYTIFRWIQSEGFERYAWLKLGWNSYRKSQTNRKSSNANKTKNGQWKKNFRLRLRLLMSMELIKHTLLGGAVVGLWLKWHRSISSVLKSIGTVAWFSSQKYHSIMASCFLFYSREIHQNPICVKFGRFFWTISRYHL